MSKANQIGQNVDPLTRDYIKAVLSEYQERVEKQTLQAQKSELEALKRRLQEAEASYNARLNQIEDLLKINPASRRRLQELIDMLSKEGVATKSSTDEAINGLRQDLTTLSRQVQAHGQSIAELDQDVTNVRTEMNTLTGKLRNLFR